MTAFYNEIDPYAAAWLRNLIAAGHIAHGVVDERSIEDIVPEELLGYTQCHFFAGIGVWSYALRRAGWPDDRPVWTGSCPCQPFSAAGKGAGVADLRHLWPAFHHLIGQCHPPVVFGEQVASKDGLDWLDLVQADLEISGYSVGATDLCAAGVGAPHIRQRLWFVGEKLAHTQGGNGAWLLQEQIGEPRAVRQGVQAGGCGDLGSLAHHHHPGLAWGQRPGERTGIQRQAVERGGEVGDMADAQVFGRTEPADGRGAHRLASGDGEDGCLADADGQREGSVGRVQGVLHQLEPAGMPGPLVDAKGEQVGLSRCSWESGIADWIPCRDGKWRPVEPGTFPLAHGAPSRVGRLRAYGNAIVAPCAEAFIRSACEAFELKDILS